MATIKQRGPHQFRAMIGRSGISQTKTFETGSAADKWARTFDGKASGNNFIDRRLAQRPRVEPGTTPFPRFFEDSEDRRSFDSYQGHY